MAYDLDLDQRVRERLGTRSDVVEKTMFGGRAFLVAGHLALASSRQGLMLRADRTEVSMLLADPRVRRVVMRGREMIGWLRVEIDESTPEDDLDRWVALALRYVDSLPTR